MAQFFAFSRKSVFANLISPATDFLGFFIFAFPMQNSNFPYILFPLKNAISGVWAEALCYSELESMNMFFWHVIRHWQICGHEMTIFHDNHCYSPPYWLVGLSVCPPFGSCRQLNFMIRDFIIWWGNFFYATTSACWGLSAQTEKSVYNKTSQ